LIVRAGAEGFCTLLRMFPWAVEVILRAVPVMQNLDLKSLQVFDALLRECNVTRAAARMDMTQPAVSRVLVRLREAFQDPLFVPAGHGMEPTRRALDLAEPLRRSIEAFSQLMRPAECFEAKDFSGQFRIATSDYISFTLLPELLQELEKTAPDVGLQVLPLSPRENLRALRAGDIDLVIWNEATAPLNYYTQRLFTDELKTIVRQGHPRIDGSITLAQFCAEHHLTVDNRYGAIREAAEQMGGAAEQPQIMISVPYFLLAHMLVARTDMVGMMASLTARQLLPVLPLQILEPPVPVPSFAVSQVWHKKQHADPAHRWLRSVIAEVSKQFRNNLP